jgi:hypothetical protein
MKAAKAHQRKETVVLLKLCLFSNEKDLIPAECSATSSVCYI